MMESVVLILLFGCNQPINLGEKEDPSAWEIDPESTPISYGFWGLNGFISENGLAEVQSRFNTTVFNTATRHPNYAVTDLLPLVRESGLQVNLRLVGDHEFYTDAAGNFDLDAWKDMLKEWRNSGVQEFIDDGTLSGHMLLDDIDTFAGRNPTGDELEEMARYSKEILPGLWTFIREEASDMPLPTGGKYQQVDASVNQYRTEDGDIDAYALLQAETAEALDLEIVNGLNIANGGDGSSGQEGWEAGKYAMSADEVREYGSVLTAMPGCVMFLNWEYDGEEEWADGSVGSDYFNRYELQDALSYLGLRVAGEVE
jgi:hypothetical protein